MILSVEIILKNYFYSVVLDTTTIFKKIKSIRITNWETTLERKKVIKVVGERDLEIAILAYWIQFRYM